MDKYCLPIEKKPMCCGDCEYQKRYECVITGKALKELLQISPDCPIVPMPDVEGLKRKLAVYEEAFEFVVSNSCPPHEICIAHETRNDDCEPCYREYLESKLKESDNWQAG